MKRRFFIVSTLLSLTLSLVAHAGTTWTTPEIIIDEAASYVSMAIDKNDKIHIIYHFSSGTKGYLKYATNATGAWESTMVGSGTSLEYGKYSSIAIDSNGGVHISYGSFGGTTGLAYAYMEAGKAWVIDIIYYAEIKSSSIAVDSNGKVHIAYITGDKLKYITKSNTWSITPIAGNVTSASLAIDSNNNPNISFYDNVEKNIKHAVLSATGLQLTAVDGNNANTADVSNFISIVPDNKQYIAYKFSTTIVPSVYGLKHAMYVPSSQTWTLKTVKSGDYGVSDIHIVVDSNGKSHISYKMTPNSLKPLIKKLKYATNSSGAWISEIVGPLKTVVGGNTIGLDSKGNVHLVFVNDSNRLVHTTPDADGDGVAVASDNCKDTANADQADADADGTGDACDSTPNGDPNITGGTNEPPPVLATEDGSSSEDSGGGGGGGCSLVR